MRHQKSVKTIVRELRFRGASLGEIHEKTKVPKTTIRTWISDIRLSEQQLRILKERSQKALQEGRVRVQKINKEKRTHKEDTLLFAGKNELTSLSTKELFVAGIALYWAEGFKNKHEHRLGFCNSDPSMIRFYIHWLQNSLGIDKNEIVARLTINQSHKVNVKKIEKYWSEITQIPLTQFTKPFYQNTTWKKQYSSNEYYGVLRIHVKNSLDNLLKMRGWIEGLKLNVVE